MYAYSELPFVFVWLYEQVRNTGQWFLLAKLGMGMAPMTPAALLIGASFALLVRAGAGGPKTLSRSVGLLYGAHTVGAIAGAVIGAVFLLPLLAVRGAVLAAAVTVNLDVTMTTGAMHLSSLAEPKRKPVLKLFCKK